VSEVANDGAGGETLAATAGAKSAAGSGSGSRLTSGSYAGSGDGWNHTSPHFAQRTLRPDGMKRALSL